MLFGRTMRRDSTDAADMLLIRLLISVVIIAMVLLLMTIASDNLRSILAEHQVEEQCHLIESSLSTMIGSGVPRDINEVDAADGTKRTLTIVLPDSLVYLSFGGDPDPMDDGNIYPRLSEDGAVIFYRVQGGSKKVIWLPKETYRFRAGTCIDNRWTMNGSGQSYVTCTGGETTLVFELIRKNHMNFILIYANDGIE